LHAATAAVGVATANLYPRLTLSASTSQQSNDLSQLFAAGSNAWSVLAGLVAPIFNGGRLRAQQRAAVAAMQASAASYQQVVLQAFAQVADVLTRLENDADQVAAQTNAMRTAQDSSQLTREAYREGAATLLQVLDADRLVQQARLGLVQAQGQRYLDTVQLFLAVAGSPIDASAAATRTTDAAAP
jgi:outer membrane protein TolC